MLSGLSATDQQLLLEPLRPILDLPEAQRSVYVRTLEALHSRGGTQSGAAAVLHVHPNTVRYRMDRIEQITRMRLDDPRDRMRLDLAALLVVLRGHPPDRDSHCAFLRGPLRLVVETFGGYADAEPIAGALSSVEVGAPLSDDSARVLAGMDAVVGTERDHQVARPQGDHLGQHRRADQRLGVEVVGALDAVGVDVEPFAMAAARLDQAGRRAVAAASIAGLEGVVSLATDLADLDGTEKAVSSHAGQISPWTGGCDSRRRGRGNNVGGGPEVPVGPRCREPRAPPVGSLTHP
jgi:hypothetical protein